MNEQAQWNSWCHFEAVGDGAEVHSNRALGEKWFQKLVITALITYSALSFPPPFLTLPPFSLFISASTWLQFMARRLSLCHPAYGFYFPLCVQQWKLFSFFNSAQLFFPRVFAFGSQTSFLYLCVSARAIPLSWRGSLQTVVLMCACFLMGIFAVLMHITFKSQPASELHHITS